MRRLCTLDVYDIAGSIALGLVAIALSALQLGAPS